MNLGRRRALIPPKAFTLRFRVAASGEITRLTPEGWVAESPTRAAMLSGLFRRRVGNRVLLEVEEVTPENSDRIARFARTASEVTVIGSRTFPTEDPSIMRAAVESRWEDVRAELAFGADPAARDVLGNSLLHYAVQNADADLVRELVQVGVPVGFRNAGDLNAEDLARAFGKEESATVLACSGLVEEADRAAPDWFSRNGHILFVALGLVASSVLVATTFVLLPLLAALVIAAVVLIVGVVLGRARTSTWPVWTPVGIDSEGLDLRFFRKRRRLEFADCSAVAVNLVQPRPRMTPVMIVVAATSEPQGELRAGNEGLAAADVELLERSAGGLLRIRHNSYSVIVFARELLTMMNSGTVASGTTHRYVEHRGWDGINVAATPLRLRKSWKLGGEADGRAREVADPAALQGVAVFANGWLEGFPAPIGEAAPLLTVTDALTAAEIAKNEGRPFAVDADPAFPWVRSILDSFAATGVTVNLSIRTARASAPLVADNALLDHIVSGRSTHAVDLVNAGWAIETGDPWNRQPLAYAVAAGDIAVVERLIEAGADPLALDDGGRSPLSLARATWGDDAPVSVACRKASQERYRDLIGRVRDGSGRG